MSASAWTPVDETAARWTPVEEAPPERGVVSGVVRGAKNLAAMPGQMWDAITKPPQTDEEKILHDSGIDTPQGHLPGPVALPFWRLIGKPMADAEDKADQYEQRAAKETNPEIKKQLLDAGGAWRIGSRVALVGPVAANLAERAAYGEQGAGQVGPSGKGGWQNENQDVTGSLGEAGTYVIAPKAAEDLLKAGAGGVKAGVKAIPKVADVVRDATPKQAAQAVGGVSGGVVSAHGSPSLSPVGAYYGAKSAGALVESLLGKERANSPIVARPQPFEQPAPFPANPTPEQLNPSLVSPARTLPGQVGPERIFGPRPVPAQPIPPRAGLALSGEVAPAAVAPGAAGSIAESVAAPKTLADLAKPTAPVSKAALGRQIESAVYDATGAEPPKPLKPNVSLKNQIKADIQAKTPLPKDFTPVEGSSAIKGYKYNAAANEMETITNDGLHYIHGGVDADQAAAFEAADSKGTAWNNLRKAPGVVRVAKVVNGQRVAFTPSAGSRSMVIDPETGQPELASVVEAKQNAAKTAATETAAPKTLSNLAKPKPPASAPSSLEEDLSAEWSKNNEFLKAQKAAKPASIASLDDVKVAPGAAQTVSADPAHLAERWEVDEESLKEGREQTRDMSPKQTEDFIQKVSTRYKKGFKVDPVVEIRDAENNITSVDGRGRVIAAQRAGVKEIPVIVRRMKAATGTE